MTREYSGTVESKAIKVGNYRFTGNILGKGTFATVEEAVHVYLKVKVSVKTINLHKCGSYVLKHLRREAAILLQVDHPHIVRLFETMKHDSLYCLVTELVRGGDLCGYLQQQRDKRLEECTTRRLSRQIVAALGALHSKGIVHRDLKLENIMLDSHKENIKLVDFGLSNNWKAECPLKTLCGSPEYSAPELFVVGSRYGAEVDMWALGVVMYAMAVGQLPFPSVATLLRDPGKKSKFLIAINNGLTEAHTNRIVGYPAEYVELLKGLMNPECQRRFSVEDVLRDPWLTNKNHWTAVQYETPGVSGLANVSKRLCVELNITEERLRAELQNSPSGEVAGFYNIMVYKQSKTRPIEMSSFPIKTSTGTKSSTYSTPKMCMPKNLVRKEAESKLCIIGVPQEINEVVKIKKPLQRGIHSIRSAVKMHSPHILNIGVNNGCHDRLAEGDWSTPPQVKPLRVRKASSSSSNTPKDKPNESDRPVGHDKVNNKKKSAERRLQLLPSKMKLRFPVCTS